MVFRWEPGAAKRIGVAASLASVAIGLLLAAFQVQGWTMPRLLAVILIVLLIVMIAIALSVIVYEVVGAVRGFLEHRATSSSWVSSERPGLLDYEADGIRASERFTKELIRLNRDTETLGKKLQRHTKAFERSKGKSAKTRQRRANRSAKDIDRSAVFIEKRSDLLQALVKDIVRNAEGLIAASNFETEADLSAAKEFRETLNQTHQVTTETLGSVVEYRESVTGIERDNLSRTVRIASGRLAGSLDGVVKMMRKHNSGSLKLVHSLDRKIAEAERSHPEGDRK
jgi:hypothetical protein